MRWTHGRWLVSGVVVVAVALGGLLASAARAEVVVVLPRPGQVGLSLSGMYGMLLKQGDLGEGFVDGPGMCVRVRYRMRYERGFGLSFEAHTFNARDGASFKDGAGNPLDPVEDYPYLPRYLHLYLYGVDFYQMFGTRTRTTKFANVGIGIAHPVRKLNDKETDYPGGDGFYASAGAGLERFFWQSLAFDLTARYQAVFHEGSTNHDVQLSAGVIFYAGL